MVDNKESDKMALNETLSPRQAKQIVTQYESCIDQTIKHIESGFTDFFVDMAHEWEDNYAVELSTKLRTTMGEVKGHLQENCDKFCDTINSIVNAYAQTGNMSIKDIIDHFSVGELHIEANIQETFDGDMFGFKDVESPDKIARAIEQLVKKLNAVILDTASKLKSVNAFGNPDVIAELATSGGRVIEILQDAVKQVEDSTKENLSKAAQAYKKTGDSARMAANIKKG